MSDSMREEKAASRLADEYLRDLDLALQDVSEVERRDTLHSVRQRLNETLADPGTVEAVQQVINELGSVDDIARMCTPAATSRRSTPIRIALILALVALAISLWMPYVTVPLAIGTLIVGIVSLRRSSAKTAWLTISVSALSLLIVAALALLLLPAGDVEIIEQEHENNSVNDEQVDPNGD